jgi:hypothetical protein
MIFSFTTMWCIWARATQTFYQCAPDSSRSTLLKPFSCQLWTNKDKNEELIVTHLEEAKRGDLKDLYITFSSAVGLKARGYAETINPLLNDYLAESPRGRVGIIAMDYFEEPRELVSNVIKMNNRSPTEDRRNS